LRDYLNRYGSQLVPLTIILLALASMFIPSHIIASLIPYMLMFIALLLLGVILAFKVKGKLLSFNLNVIEKVKEAFILDIGSRYIALTPMIIEDIPYTHSDFTPEDFMRYSKGFTSILASTPGPFIVAIVRGNVDVSTYIKKLESKILHYKVMAQADPTNPHLERKVIGLEKVLRRVSHGEKPVRLSLLIIPYAIGGNKHVIVDEVLGRAKSLKLSFESTLGLKCKFIGINELLRTFISNKSKSYLNVLEGDISFLAPISRFKRPYIEDLDDGIYLGEDIDMGTPIFYNFKTHSLRHLVVIGPTGRGKTTFLKTLVSRVSSVHYDVAIWIVDFRGEFKPLESSGFKVIDASNNPINVLKNHYTNPKLRARQIIEALQVVSTLTPMEEYVLYLNLVKLLNDNDSVRFSDLVESLKAKAEKLGFEERSQIYSLISKLEPFSIETFEEGSEVRFTLGEHTVLDLSRLPEEYRDFYVANFLQALHNYMYTLPPDEKLRGILVIDEAWRMLRCKSGRELVMKLVKEGRAFGISIVISTQDLTDLPKEILDNAGTIIVFGSNSREYIEAIASYMSLNEHDKERMLWLKVGEALVRVYGDPRPLWVRVVPENIGDEEILKL